MLITTFKTQKSSSILLVEFSCQVTVRGDLRVSLLETDVGSRRVKLNFLAFQHDQIILTLQTYTLLNSLNIK